jgi:hypothetical protein
MKTKHGILLRGIDNTNIAAATTTAASRVSTNKPLRRPRANDPLMVAAREAEAAHLQAKEDEARAWERYEANDVSHGDQTWDNGNAAHTATAAREAAEERLREAKREYARAFGVPVGG